jgi:hypothetical protein
MPLYIGARSLIRANLQALKEGRRAPIIAIGVLTDRQRDAINEKRVGSGWKPVEAEILFVGRHIYQSRVRRDGYTLDDVVDQIANALDAVALVVAPSKMTAIENPNVRSDGYGNQVRDRAIFECSARHPKVELFSVIPRGDVRKPK